MKQVFSLCFATLEKHNENTGDFNKLLLLLLCKAFLYFNDAF